MAGLIPFDPNNVEMTPEEEAQAAAMLQDQPSEMVNPATGVPNYAVGIQGTQQKLSSPEYQKLLNQYNDLSNSAISQQKEGLAQNEQALKAYEDRGAQVDLAPLAAFSDSMFGTKYAPGYKSPESPDTRAQQILALRNALQTQRQGVTKEQLDAIKNQLSAYQLPYNQSLKLARLSNQDRSLGMREDAQAAQAVQNLDNNPLIQASTRQLGQIQIDRHTIENSPIVTPQMLHEISNGIASALNQGKGVGIGMAELQDMSTGQTKLAALEQQLLNEPKNGASPAIRQQIMDTLDRLEEAYGKYQSALVTKLAQGRTYSHNAQARSAIQSAVGKYQVKPKEKTAAPEDPVQAELKRRGL